MPIIEIFMLLVVFFGVGIFVSAASEKVLMNTSGILAIMSLVMILITVYNEEYVRTFTFVTLLILNTLTYFKYRERSKS